MYKIIFQKKDDDGSVEALMDQAFGVDRTHKLAYRFRDHVKALKKLSFVMKDGDDLVASLRFWPVALSGEDGKSSVALLLGPIAVSSDYQGKSLGQILMDHGLKAAKELGYQSVILVGDESYYEKMGFSRAAASKLKIKGFKDYHRLLGLEFKEGHLTDQKFDVIPVSKKSFCAVA